MADLSVASGLKVRKESFGAILGTPSGGYFKLNSFELGLLSILSDLPSLTESSVLAASQLAQRNAVSTILRKWRQSGILVTAKSRSPRLQFLRSQVTRRDILSAPMEVSVAPTMRCNHRCFFCLVGPLVSNPTAWHEVLDHRLIDALVDVGVFRVHLVGGEPFLYRGTLGLVHAMRNNDIDVSITTNGSIAKPSVLGDLISSGTRLYISVHGDTAELHNSQVNFPGSFERAMGTLQELRRLEMPVSAAVTVTKRNSGRLRSIMARLHSVGVIQCSLAHGVEAGSLALHRSDAENPAHAYERMVDAQILGQELGMEVTIGMQHSDAFAQLTGLAPGGPVSSSACTAGASTMYVLPNGDVVPCELLASDKWVAGNLLVQDMKSIWDTAAAFERFRHRPLGDQCSACKFFTDCQGGCPAMGYLSGQPFGTRPSTGCPLVNEQSN